MVSVESVVTTRRSLQDRVKAGAPRALNADHLDPRSQSLQHIADAGSHSPATEGDQDGVAGGQRADQLQADGRHALAGLDVQAHQNGL